MTVLTVDKSVSTTTEWMVVANAFLPFEVQAFVTVPMGVTVDYSLQGTAQREITTVVDDEIITYSNMENETATKVVVVKSPVSHFRILINSISGGAI